MPDPTTDAASDNGRPPDEHRLGLVGDGWDPEPLWTAQDVGEFLGIPPKSAYDLPIQRVRVSKQRIRWRPADVRRFVERRTEGEL